MKKIVILLTFCLLQMLCGCVRGYNEVSIANITDKEVYAIIVSENGRFTALRFFPNLVCGFDTTSENNVHGPAYIYMYIYGNSIPNNLYGNSDGLKKYVNENKADSEYSLKVLYSNMQDYRSRDKRHYHHVIIDDKIAIMPFDQYWEIQKKRRQ
jgi:hypothetical protein